MGNFDIQTVGTDALNAGLAALKGHAQKAEAFLKAEATKIAQTGLQIVEGQANGDINAAQAEILLQMQANASQAVLTAVETIGMIAAQDAINAALGVVRAAVNKAIGIAFL